VRLTEQISTQVSTTLQHSPSDPEILGDWPANGLEHLGACPVCGSTSRTKLYENLTDRVFRCAPGRWTMWRCEGCGSAYLDPRPTRETIHLAYTSYYTHQTPGERPPPPDKWFRRMRRALADGYRNVRYGTHFAGADRFGYVLARLVPHLREPIDVEFRYLPHPGRTVTRRLLDVGCGNGGFLLTARTAGWEVYGCDPDPAGREAAGTSGIEVRSGGIETWADREGWFDAITMSHVIEHVHDPVEVLRATFRLLRPGGRLYVEAPNVGSAGHAMFGHAWLHLDPPRHLVLFDHAILGRLLHEAGFSNLRWARRHGVLQSSIEASLRVERGLDPFRSSLPPGVERPSLLQRVAAKLTPARSEFLTVVATKPETER
jgi:2-polyprenyl-3-methyl-5-hydroxy-6-metoxy-1,4-benzoquinol methylase